MALYDDYFTNEDKPFAENLNDALLLSNVFDMTVDVEAPLMFSNSTWGNTTSPRKCSVSILTLKEGLPSGVSVGTDSETGNSTLTGTGTVELSWYPNFNAFGKFKSINWEAEGNITVNLKTSNGTTIASNISKGIIENQSSELRTLQEIVIELVFSNATLKNLIVTMENKSQERYGATVGITDVTGLDDRLTSIENKDIAQDLRLSALEEVDDGVFFYQIYAEEYNPLIDTSVNIHCKCTDIEGVSVSGKSLTLYDNGTSVSASITNNDGVASWTITLSDWNVHHFNVHNVSLDIKANGWKEVWINTSSNPKITVEQNANRCRLIFTGYTANLSTSWVQYGSTAFLLDYAPKQTVHFSGADGTYEMYVNEDGKLYWKSSTGSSQTSRNLYGQYEWSIA